MNTYYKKEEGFKVEIISLKVKKLRYLYRTFDIAFTIFAISLFMPIMLLVAILIKINSPEGSILFKQKRLGLNGKLFNVYKFRTMLPNAEKKLSEMMEENQSLKDEYLTFRKLKNDPRIIPHVGNFLRKSSLDELPQFFNVMFGDMSIVGPRPYIEEEFSCYSSDEEVKAVTSVKPGITGYWQTIPERHEMTFKSRVESDMEYIKKKSFSLDLEIIVKTVGVMILRKGA